MTQVPLAPPPPANNTPTDKWLWLLWRRLTQAGQILWGSLDFSGSNLTDLETRNHNDLQNVQGGAASDYYHLTGTQHTDLTDGGNTTLHKHTHNNSDGLQGGTTNQYYHLTSTELSELLSAPYITVDGMTASLTGERQLAVGTGLDLTDNGAGSTIQIDQVEFAGDAGSGGFIGAVPAPAAGDGTAGSRKYLSADGEWRNPGTSGDTQHNTLVDLEGGIATGVFEDTAFEPTAFQFGVTEYFHVTEAQFDNLTRINSVTTVSIDTVMDDTYSVYIVDTSAVTMTLPEAIPSRIGFEWSVVMNCNGYVDIEPDPTDEIILFGGSDTIRLDQLGSTLTLRCISSTQWVIV